MKSRARSRVEVVVLAAPLERVGVKGRYRGVGSSAARPWPEGSAGAFFFFFLWRVD